MLSKVEIIKEKILSDIKSGRLSQGQSLPSRHQFARMYSCSRGSVDAAVSQLVQQGYLHGKKGSGTFVASRSGRSSVRQVFLIDTFSQRSRGERASDSSYLAAEIQRFLPCFLHCSDELNVRLGKIVSPGNAVIWFRPSYHHLMVMDYLAEAGVPQLLIGRSYKNFDFVATDAKAGIREGVRWLVERTGGEGMVFITQNNFSDIPYIAERQIAFYETCIELGVSLQPQNLFRFDFKNLKADIFAANSTLFKRGRCPPAIFLTYYQAAFSIVTFAECSGFMTGRDFYLLLFDHEPSLEGHPGIGMLRQRWLDMTSSALDWLRLKMGRSDFQAEFKIRLPPEFICAENAAKTA